MKKILLTIVALTAAVYAQDLITVKITGDRVSLRAAPDTNAVLLGKAMMGEELILQDNLNADWVGVCPPETINFWVSGEFVSNSVVLPELLNIRSGPSLSHSVVGSALKGDTLTVRGEAGGWLKVAPTSNTTVWISRAYADVPIPAPIEPVAVPVELPVAQDPVLAVVETVPAPAIEVTAVAELTVQEVVEKLAPVESQRPGLNPLKPQEVDGSFSGILQPADGSFYKLVDDHFTDIDVCYVRGNSAQMKTFTGLKLYITGKTYWIDGKDLPVIVPVTIKPFSNVK